MLGFVEGAQVRTFTQRLRDAWQSFRTTPSPPESNLQRRRRGGLTNEVSYSSPYSLYGGDPTPYNPNEIISRQGYARIDEMRRDDQIKAAINFKKYAVLAAGWTIRPPDGQSEDWEVVKFVESALNEIEGTLERTMLEILTALDYGFSLSEKVWAERDDGKLGIKKIATRYPRDLTFQSDPYGNVTGLRQNGRDLPYEKFVHYAYDYEFGNPYGNSDLTAAYRAWWSKKNAYTWMSMLLERLGIPPVIALYNPNKYIGTMEEKLRTFLSKLQSATVATIPRASKDDLELWAPELASQVATVFVPAIEMYNKDIARSLLMPGLLGMGSEDKVGSFARAKVHFDVFMLVLERLRSEFAERVMNEQVVNELVGFNFNLPADQYPYFEFLPLTEAQTNELATAWKTLVDAKAVKPQDEDERKLRELFEMPELDEQDQQARSERMQEMAPIPQPGLIDRRQPQQGQQQKPPLTQKQFEQLLDELT